MRTIPSALFILGLIACGRSENTIGEVGADTALAQFDPSVVVYADGCATVPEAQGCIEANPVQFLPGDANAISQRCVDLGYTCCDPADWISPAAASCIAESDVRLQAFYDNIVTLSCYTEVYGPMYDVYENTPSGLVGLGVHAATGRVTWFDDGSGVFS